MAEDKDTGSKKKIRRGPYGRKFTDTIVDDYVNQSEVLGRKPAVSFHSSTTSEQLSGVINERSRPVERDESQKTSDCREYEEILDNPVGHVDAGQYDSQEVPEQQRIDEVDVTTDLDTILKDYIQDFIEADELKDVDTSDDNDDIYFDTVENADEVDMLVTDDVQTNKESIDDNTPLFPGSRITVGALMLLLAIYTTTQGITGEGIEILLKIIAFIIPNGHNLCTTLYSFKNYFKNLRNPLVKHFYCLDCLTYISVNDGDQCPNSKCGKANSSGYFLEVPLDSQIQSFMSQENFFNSLQERFSRSTDNNGYKDIYDGSLYKSYCDRNGPLNSPNNISFLFNTDGAPVFKSSKVSIWPIFLIINELPYSLRMKKENMILAGLWFGKKKPSFGTFFKPFISSLKLFNDGINCKSPERGEFLCRGFLLAGTMDLPARSIVCNSVQYNGSYGCWKCLQKGETAFVGKGHTHVFPYHDDNPKGPKRTTDGVVEDSKKVVQQQHEGKKNVTECGVKGPSRLLLVPRFNIVTGIAIDYMHGVLLGVQKLLLTLWFAPKHSSKVFSFNKEVHAVDKRLLQIRPTLDITRLPRSIEHDIQYWKASEYRAFLLFYGAPVLFGILDEARFHHYLLFVNAIHILLTTGSSTAAVDKAESSLLLFCRRFSQLYDKCYMTLNMHQLVHLADSVRELGPLYTHSCFSFEDKNGFILKMIRGTQNIDNQILTGVSFVQKLPELKQTCIPKNSELEEMCKTIEVRNYVKRGKKVTKDVYILGGVSKRKMKEDEYMAATNFLGVCPLNDCVDSFLRMEIHGFYVYGLEYGRMIKRNNAAVKIRGSTFGLVRYFMELECGQEEEGQSITVAVVEELTPINFRLGEILPILQVVKTQHLNIVDVKNIEESCVFVEISQINKCYICLLPNTLESD